MLSERERDEAKVKSLIEKIREILENVKNNTKDKESDDQERNIYDNRNLLIDPYLYPNYGYYSTLCAKFSSTHSQIIK
jgi:hypothetical protein